MLLAARRCSCNTAWLLHKRGMAMSKDVVAGANYMKAGSDPALRPDSEYPDWLWDIMKPREPLFALQRKLGPERDIKTISLEEAMRLVKLENRVEIKEHNTNKAKK